MEEENIISPEQENSEVQAPIEETQTPVENPSEESSVEVSPEL